MAQSLPHPRTAREFAVQARARLACAVTAHALRSVLLILPRPLLVQTSAGGPTDAPPALRRLLSRARGSRLVQDGLHAELLQVFRVGRQRDWPVAAFSWLGDGGARDAAYRLRADPVHLRADRDALVLVNTRDVALATEEAGLLVEALNTQFEADGLRFVAPVPTRWYVSAARAPELRTQPLEFAAGRSIDPLLPSGPDALLWHRYFNEIQMLLHAHPINTAREEAGRLPVNSVWFWGGGVLPAEARTDLAAVWADDPVARGLAHAAGVQCLPPPRTCSEWLGQAAPGGHLVLLDALDASLEALERDWFGPLLEALRGHAIQLVSLIVGYREQMLRYELTPGDLWKFWRRAPALTLP